MSVKTFKEGIKLDPQSADPTATEGQVQFADGTVRPKGLYQYKDGAWSGIGGGAGDADTIHLIKANDSQASDFSLKSIDDVLPDFEGSDTLAGTFSIPTTGSEALLSNDDDHKVFKFASAASSQYDAWGISKSLPRYIRGEDVVLQFKYRTADTSGASADGDYMIWVWDETNGVNTTTTSTGSVSAGTAITVGTTTGMSVGDKIWVGETGGTAQVTEAHVTEVTSGTQVKISETVNLSSGDRFVTGILTDVLTTLDAADDDTNKTGNDFKAVFNVPSDCAQVTVMFQQLTSETDSFLFVDNILISSEVVKRVFARGESKKYKISEAQNAMSNLTGEVQFNSPVETYDEGFLDLFTIDHSSDPSKWTAKKKVKVSVQVNGELASARQMHLAVNGTPLMNGTTTDTSNYNNFVSADTVLNKGDYITFGSGSDGSFDGTSLGSTATSCIATFTATPEVNDVVVVESTDSVISEWVDSGAIGISATTTAPTKGTVGNDNMKWRRVGDSMHIRFAFNNSGGSPSNGSGDYLFKMPSGYKIDLAKIDSENSSADQVTGATVGSAFVATTSSENANFASIANVTVYDEDYVRLVHVGINTGGGTNITSKNVGSDSFQLANNPAYTADYVVPIAGWDANPKPLLALPTVTYGQDAEHCKFDTRGDADGRASTNTRILYFATERYNTISNLGTVANSATEGWSFTATRRCKVHFAMEVFMTSAQWVGLSKNSSSLSTDFTSLSEDEQVATGFSNGGGEPASVTYNAIMEPGDVIRPHTTGSATVDSAAEQFMLSLLVEPEEGQVNQAAIISQPTAYFKERQNSGVASSTSNTGTGYRTCALNTLSGDIAAVGVIDNGDNSVTIPAGKYKIGCINPVRVNDSTFVAYAFQSRIRNTTDNTTIVVTNSCEARNSGNTSGHVDTGTMLGEEVVTFTKDTTLELQLYLSSPTSNPINGGAASTGERETYGQMYITRMK